jgi:hypothetical protein
MLKKKNDPSKLLDIPFIKKIKKDNSKVARKRNWSKTERLQALKNLGNFLHGKPYTLRKVQKAKLTEKEIFVEKLSIATNEITTSMWKLYITLTYVKNLRSNSLFSKEELLQYFYENYINELYIYTERILNIITLVEKKAEKLQIKPFYNLLVGARRSYIEICKQVRSIRNEHNHQLRFKDFNFDRLNVIKSDLIKPFITSKDKKIIYQNIKKKYLKEILNEIVIMHKMSQTIFIPIDVIVYDVILPKL